MKIKSKLNWITQLIVLAVIFIFIRFTFRPEISKPPSISVIAPGVVLFLYALYSFYITMRAKKLAIHSFKVKTNRIVPLMTMIVTGFLLAFQALIFVFQKDNGYHLYSFIMNTGMFSCFVLMSLYHLIFTRVYFTSDGLFFRAKISKANYNFLLSSDKIEILPKKKLTYLSYMRIDGEEETLKQINEIINPVNPTIAE